MSEPLLPESFTSKYSLTKDSSNFMDAYRLTSVGGAVPPVAGPTFMSPPTSTSAAPIAGGAIPEGHGSSFPTVAPTAGATYFGRVPEVKGGWMEGAKLGLGAVQVGLGIWNALEQAKINKFMRGYYGDQMAMQRTDFANNAKSTNQMLESRQKSLLSAQGFAFDSPENKAGTADAMAKWGVKETF